MSANLSDDGDAGPCVGCDVRGHLPTAFELDAVDETLFGEPEGGLDS